MELHLEKQYCAFHSDLARFKYCLDLGMAKDITGKKQIIDFHVCIFTLNYKKSVTVSPYEVLKKGFCVESALRWTRNV